MKPIGNQNSARAADAQCPVEAGRSMNEAEIRLFLDVLSTLPEEARRFYALRPPVVLERYSADGCFEEGTGNIAVGAAAFADAAGLAQILAHEFKHIDMQHHLRADYLSSLEEGRALPGTEHARVYDFAVASVSFEALERLGYCFNFSDECAPGASRNTTPLRPTPPAATDSVGVSLRRPTGGTPKK